MEHAQEAAILIVPEAEEGVRLDVFLARHHPGLSRSRLQKLIHRGEILRNGAPARPGSRLAAGDRIRFPPAADDDGEAVPAAVAGELAILYVDAAILAIDKPAGQVVHPAAGHRTDTLTNALVAAYPDLAANFEGRRPGIVHRLDRDTSGVMIVARTPAAAEHLKAQFRNRTVEKHYLALVKGEVSPPEALIDAPIGRDRTRRNRMQAVADGRPSQTRYRLLATSGGYSWLEIRPLTGRTHQIRVHMAAIGHPVAGDSVYGRRDRRLGRLALHAWRLSIDHPASDQRVTFTAPLPEDLRAAVEAIIGSAPLPPRCGGAPPSCSSPPAA